MTRNQIWATVGGVVAALVLGIGVVLVATGGGDNADSISTAATKPTVSSTTTTTITPTTIPPTTTPVTTPPTPAPTIPPPTVIVIPPTQPPVTPTEPPTIPPTVPPTDPPVTTTTAPSLAPTITGFSPLKGAIGTKVTITGTHLADVDTVAFDGVEAADFTVDGDTQITVTVPVGATTGKISVTSAEGTGVSAKKFRVLTTPPTTIPCDTTSTTTSAPTTTTTTTTTTTLPTTTTTDPCAPTTTTSAPVPST